MQIHIRYSAALAAAIAMLAGTASLAPGQEKTNQSDIASMQSMMTAWPAASKEAAMS